MFTSIILLPLQLNATYLMLVRSVQQNQFWHQNITSNNGYAAEMVTVDM